MQVPRDVDQDHELLLKLEELRLLLEKSPVEKYRFFLDHNMAENPKSTCQWAIKSKEIFVREHKNKITNVIKEIVEKGISE